MLLLCLITGLLIPPFLFNDLAAGWQVWTSMQAGAPFNSVWVPAADNLARDTAVFQSWWSPGQYLVPALVMQTGLSFGQAVVVAGVLANALGLAGFWRVWRTLGVTPSIMAASGGVVVLCRAFGAIVGMANLADALQFAAVPWVTLLVWRWRRLSGWHWLGLFLVFNAGVGLKLSFQIAALAMLGGVVLQAAGEIRGRAWWWLAVKVLLLWLAVRLVWDWGYLGRGASIGAVHGPQGAGLAEASLPWGGPLFAIFSTGALLSRIFLHPGEKLLTSEQSLWPFFLFSAIITLVLVRRLWRAHEMRIYAGQAVAWLVVYGAVFTVLYATGAAVSLEERHFQVAGLVLLPGVLWGITQMTRPALRRLAVAAVAGFCLYGVASVFVHARFRLQHGVEGRQGFLHAELTAGALAELRRLDDEPGGRTLFFMTKPEIALEVRRGRMMCLPLDSWGEGFVRRFTYEGRADRVVLVMPERDVRNGRVEWIKAGLHGYREWDTRAVDGFFFITGR